MKVVHLTSAHGALDTRIFHKECRTLANNGFETVLVAAHEKSTTLEGVRIEAVPPSRGRLTRMTLTAFRVLRTGIREDGDLYQFHDSELWPGAVLLKCLGKRVVHDVHEDTPRSMLSKEYLPPVIRWLVSITIATMEKLGALFFDGIVAATPAIARRFPSSKTLLVQNFPDLEVTPRQADDSERVAGRAIYAGVVTKGRCAAEMMIAVGLVENAHLEVVGKYWPPELEQELRNLKGSHQTSSLGWLSRDEVLVRMCRASIGLVVFRPEPNHLEAQPNKLFEYMQCGLPVVASNFPLWREIVERHNCGLLVDPTDVNDIAKAIRWLTEHPAEARAMGDRGRQAVHGFYNWGVEGPKLVAYYRDLLGAAA